MLALICKLSSKMLGEFATKANMVVIGISQESNSNQTTIYDQIQTGHNSNRP